MKECPNCGEDLEGWHDITTKCTAKITFTNTDSKMAYVLLEHDNIVIGSLDGDKFSYHEVPYAKGSRKYRVLSIKKGGYHIYYRIFMKED